MKNRRLGRRMIIAQILRYTITVSSILKRVCP